VRRYTLGVVVLSVTAALVAPLATSAGATSVAKVSTAPGDTVTFTGHGWGHGRGMGQYGAFGYAVDKGWTYDKILAYYYQPATLRSDAGNPDMTVELTAFQGKDAILTGPGLYINHVPVNQAAVRIVSVDATTFRVDVAPSCGGAWTPWQTYRGVDVDVWSSQDPGVLGNLVRVCETDTTHGYRGILTAHHGSDGVQYLINRVTTESYLRGVVPRESPASWGSAGGGRGMQALEAQAVAARSYALASSRASGAKTCDTTACQVYQGAYVWPYNGTLTGLENSLTDQAIALTAGQVMRMPNGSVARTEFSSSTGGYTAGGTFAAVPDDGDATTSNPNHNWMTSVSAGDVAARLGVSGLRALTVTARNGLGADGGRVTTIGVTDGAGRTTSLTGDQFRSKLGLKSDWFSVSWVSPAEARSVVTALYADLLGRGPDQTGLDGWSAALMVGVPQPTVAHAITTSDEYISLRVAQAYRQVLGRGPDAVGARDWLAAVRSGAILVDAVQRRFYDSDEYFAKSGGTWDGYVRLLYTTILGRGASDAEVALWVGLVPRYGRAWLVDSVWWSREAASVRTRAYYKTFLGREPDPVGLDAWTTVLLASGEGAVRDGIAGSIEYRNRAMARFP
jgi:SpoIID/LytB domain protein